jgi:Zn-dependent peptidase ImmA (M78 family)
MRDIPKPSNFTKAQIAKVANQVAKRIGYSPSSDLSELLSKFGGKVSIKDFWQLDGTSDESIVVRSRRDFEIFVPPHTSPERDRFTIAHELGHFVLHYPSTVPSSEGRPFSASRYGSDRIEWEANWFAANLLMPASSFKRQFVSRKGNIWRIAEHFSVSPAAAYVRAKTLGLEHAGGTSKI